MIKSRKGRWMSRLVVSSDLDAFFSPRLSGPQLREKAEKPAVSPRGDIRSAVPGTDARLDRDIDSPWAMVQACGSVEDLGVAMEEVGDNLCGSDPRPREGWAAWPAALPTHGAQADLWGSDHHHSAHVCSLVPDLHSPTIPGGYPDLPPLSMAEISKILRALPTLSDLDSAIAKVTDSVQQKWQDPTDDLPHLAHNVSEPASRPKVLQEQVTSMSSEKLASFEPVEAIIILQPDDVAPRSGRNNPMVRGWPRAPGGSCYRVCPSNLDLYKNSRSSRLQSPPRLVQAFTFIQFDLIFIPAWLVLSFHFLQLAQSRRCLESDTVVCPGPSLTCPT